MKRSRNLPPRRHHVRAFTLIELLTVIAIIAVLAGIIFPVFAQVRNSAARSSCMSNMMKIQQAVKLYHLDNRSYPDFLFGPVTDVFGDSSSNAYFGQPIGTSMADATNAQLPNPSQPAGPTNLSNLSRLTRLNGLYPEYIKSVGDFRCPHNLISRTPNDGIRRQVVWNRYTRGAAPPVQQVPIEFWAYDAYDTNPAIDPTNRTLVQGTSVLRYSKVWTQLQVPLGNYPPSYARQLVFKNPSDDTYLTMCSNHVSQTKVIVLFLSGQAKVYDVRKLDPVANASFAPNNPPDYFTYRFTPDGATL